MCERILAQNCQKFDDFNFEFLMSHHNAHYQSYKNAPYNETLQVFNEYLPIISPHVVGTPSSTSTKVAATSVRHNTFGRLGLEIILNIVDVTDGT